MNAQCAFSVMLAPSRATPNWPWSGFVSFFASATNSDHVFGGAAIPACLNSFLLKKRPYDKPYSGTEVGVLPGAPLAANDVDRNLSLPPTVFRASPSNGRNAPVDCSVADHVFPMFRTSGPLPLVTAVVMFVKRSGHGITLKFTFTPVCLVNWAIALLKTCLP